MGELRSLSDVKPVSMLCRLNKLRRHTCQSDILRQFRSVRINYRAHVIELEK
jgi:hypothetical protein